MLAAQESNGARPAPRRTPPHSQPTEAALVGGALVWPEVLGLLDRVETDDFHVFPHKVVWNAIRAVQAAGRPVDQVTVLAELERQGRADSVGGVAFLGELVVQGVAPAEEVVTGYVAELKTLARNRAALIALSSALERAWNWPHDPGELVGEVTAELHRIESLAKAPEPSFRLMSIDDGLDDLASVQNAPIFTTPFDTLNDAIGFGGLLGTQVYTVAAGTGRGKTTWVGAVAAHVAERIGVPVLVSVHELGPGYFIARKAAGILGVHSNEIIRGAVERRLIHRALPYPNMFFLKRPTLRALREATDHLAQRFGKAPLLIVDYLQKLADEIAARQQRPDLRLATNEASTALLEIGERTGAAIMAVSSIGRGKSTLKTPRKHHPYDLVEVAKESGAVEYDGAGMIVLTLSDEKDAETGERIGTITLAKARFGRELHIDARYDGARGIWRDLGEVATSKAAEPKPTAAKPAKEATSLDELKQRLIKSLQESPARGKDNLVERVTGNKTKLRAAYDELANEQVIVRVGTGITLSELGRQRLMVGV